MLAWSGTCSLLAPSTASNSSKEDIANKIASTLPGAVGGQSLVKQRPRIAKAYHPTKTRPVHRISIRAMREIVEWRRCKLQHVNLSTLRLSSRLALPTFGIENARGLKIRRKKIHYKTISSQISLSCQNCQTGFHVLSVFDLTSRLRSVIRPRGKILNSLAEKARGYPVIGYGLAELEPSP